MTAEGWRILLAYRERDRISAISSLFGKSFPLSEGAALGYLMKLLVCFVILIWPHPAEKKRDRMKRPTLKRRAEQGEHQSLHRLGANLVCFVMFAYSSTPNSSHFRRERSRSQNHCRPLQRGGELGANMRSFRR